MYFIYRLDRDLDPDLDLRGFDLDLDLDLRGFAILSGILKKDREIFFINYKSVALVRTNQDNLGASGVADSEK